MNDEQKPQLIPLGKRTKDFALRVIRLLGTLPHSQVAQVIANQMLRSATSIGAHCREGFRGRSNAELISKLEVAAQELDETIYWFELLAEAEIVKPALLHPLTNEADQIMSVIVSSVKTIKERNRR